MPSVSSNHSCSRLWPVLISVCALPLWSPAQTEEFRALWADAWGAGFQNASEVTTLVSDLRAGNFNAVIPQVRRRGDSFYNSNYEPKNAGLAAGFDPLADILSKAHNTNSGAFLEVHAWIVTYHIWSSAAPPPQPDHPLNLHPDWLLEDYDGNTFIGGQYTFDPGHPDVQRHTFNVCMDIITNYNVQGLNFDYIRYSSRNEGYNPVTVARFNRRFSRTGKPSPTDETWKQFRRDQITGLLRKVYLNAIAVKPHIKISADTITWHPGPASLSAWYSSSAAWNSVLQDWRGWMEEGILDLNIPMAYFDQAGAYTLAWTNWNNFAKDHRYDRHVAIGPGIYLNSVANAIRQMRFARTPSPGGNYADGISGYSYRVTNKDGVARATVMNALVSPSSYDAVTPPIFATPATPKPMPWKTAPTKGHLKGFIYGESVTNALDGAVVSISGPFSKTMTNDATGFYGAVDLSPGNYTLTASFPGLLPKTASFVITAGVVTTLDVLLRSTPEPPPPNFITNVTAAPRFYSAMVSWNTLSNATAQVEYGLTTDCENLSPMKDSAATNHNMLLLDLTPNTTYFYRAVSRMGTNEYKSATYSFFSTPSLILDNPQAAYYGLWTLGVSSPDKYGSYFQYAFTVAGPPSSEAIYTPMITMPGPYDVYVWYPEGPNRTTNAPVRIFSGSGLAEARVNQTGGGGAWRLIATGLEFDAGASGSISILNNTGETNKIVIADAFRLSSAAGQDIPLDGSVPGWWANYYFGAGVNGSLDHDGDGLTAHSEYVLGTDPTDSNSRLTTRMERASPAGVRVVFWPARTGRAYELQCKTNLSTGTWQTLSNLQVTVSNGQGIITVTNLAARQGLYRLSVRLVP